MLSASFSHDAHTMLEYSCHSIKHFSSFCTTSFNGFRTLTLSTDSICITNEIRIVLNPVQYRVARTRLKPV